MHCAPYSLLTLHLPPCLCSILSAGIVVQLEHVQVDAANPGEAGGVGSSTLASRSVESDAPEEPLLLVCETSMKLRNYSELAFEHLPYPAAGRDQDSGGDRSGHHGGDRESASAHEAAAREAMAALANDTLNTSTPEGASGLPHLPVGSHAGQLDRQGAGLLGAIYPLACSLRPVTMFVHPPTPYPMYIYCLCCELSASWKKP